MITFEMWADQTEEVLWEEAERQGLDHIDELELSTILYIRHRMCEEWINYKARTGQLI